MPIECRGAVFTGPWEVEVGRVTVPDPGPGEVRVRNEACIISNGTESWVWSGRFHSPGKPPSYQYPIVPGYQRVGWVESLGEGAQGVEVGQRVFATIGRLEGSPASAWGSHAEYAVCDDHQCLPVPDSIASEDVAGLVLTQVGYNGGSRPPVHEGTVALVIGDGLVGQWAAQTYRHRGARVIVAGRRPRRLELAAAHSADETINARAGDLAEQVRQLAPEGVDIVNESVGHIANVELACTLLKHNGHLVLDGYHPEGEHLMNIQWLHDRELTCWGMAGWTRPRLEETLALIGQGALRVRELITHEFAGHEADRAYKMIRDRSEDHLGILIRWA